MFLKLDLFPFSGEGRKTLTLLGPLERMIEVSSFKDTVSPSPHLKMETDPVSETLCFLVFRILDNGKSPLTQ
jgi:hypothetical protein